jgi:hypothetical protein
MKSLIEHNQAIDTLMVALRIIQNLSDISSDEGISTQQKENALSEANLFLAINEYLRYAEILKNREVDE